MNADTFALQQTNRIEAGAWIKLVNNTGGEEIDIGGPRRSFSLFAHFVSVGKLVKPMFRVTEMYDTTDT